MIKELYEVRQIDAWKNEEDMWTWNDSHVVKEGYVHASITADYTQKAKRILRKIGYSTRWLRPNNDCDQMVEFQSRKDDEPIIAVIFKGI